MDGRRGAEFVLLGISAFSFAMLCAVLAAMGPNPLATLLLPAATCYALARGWRGTTMSLLMLGPMAAAMSAALLAAAGPWNFREAPMVVVVWYAGVIAAGVPMGRAIGESRTWRAAFAGGLAPIYLVTALFLGVFWETWLSGGREAFAWLDVNMREGSLGSDLDEVQLLQTLERLEAYMVTHWADISIGLTCGVTAVCLAAGLSGVNVWYRWRTGRPGLSQGVLETRVPDWLVWVVIAAAALFFVDDRWPNEALRMVSWNTAIGLAFIYWIAGMAIVLYVLRAVGTHPLVMTAAVMIVFLLQIHLMVVMVGLFDTWADFRGRVDKALAARKERAERSDDEW